MKRIWSNIKKHWLSLFLGVVFSVIFISFVYSVQRDPNLSQALVAFGTLILALVTSLTILNSREQEKRDRKERLLNEIVEWATEINTVSLKTELPKIDPSLELEIEKLAAGNDELLTSIKSNIMRKEDYRITAGTLFRYSIPVSKAGYIKALASEHFEGHKVAEILDDIINTLPALEFLIGKQIGLTLKEGFGPSAVAIMNHVEEELKDPAVTADSLFNKYATQLSHSVDSLYAEAARIVSRL